MHSKTHRQNHDFQIAHFLAGKCHTPDGAYALLCDLKEDRKAAIANYQVSQKRVAAKLMRINKMLESEDAAERLEAQADLEEIENGQQTGKVLYDAAVDEANFIQRCIDAIQPHRKYAHLSDPEAHEAAQREEWKFELIERAENYLLCTGTIPHDEFSTMRSHPDFKQAILPAIDQVRQQLLAGKPASEILLTERPDIFTPLLTDRSQKP
jgi:hypothetical protein